MRQSKVPAFVVAILVTAGGAQAPAWARSADEADGVRLQGTWFEEPVRRAVRGAARRLAVPSCAAVLDDFHDPAGQRLGQRLVGLAVDAPAYTRMILFYDGSNDAPCHRTGVYAFTAPGSRVVRTCPSLGLLVSSSPDAAEAVVIHELLHTLGLAEYPPSSESITARVERRCRAR